MSQLELALQAGVSSRHLSFVETGRARPSADILLHLADADRETADRMHDLVDAATLR